MNILAKTTFRAILTICFLTACLISPALGGDPSVKIALVHFKAGYKELAHNLEALDDLHREAAAKGAKIIFNTELAMSGYSFSSREDVRPYTLTLESLPLQKMAALAKELRVYIGITFPERDPATDIFYNTAAVFSPQGRLVCKYRKIWGETRWARSGGAYQNNVFSTPWGTIGVAICADSYFSLIPRTLALKGADLIWVPANWPPGGTLSPLDVWQTRALENGVYLAACNRTGKDRIMDCSKSVSAVIFPDGVPMFAGSSDTSKLFFAQIPLNRDGKIDDSLRISKMAQRKVDTYGPLYLKPWTENLTRYYQLPDPGKISVHALTMSAERLNFKTIEQEIVAVPSAGPALWLLPQTQVDDLDTKRLQMFAKKYNCAFAGSFAGKKQSQSFLLISQEEVRSFTTDQGELPYQLLHFGPAALAMVPMEALRQPELAVVLAKQGCDLVLVSEQTLSDGDARLATVRTIDNLAVAASGNNQALIAHLPEIHGQLKLHRAEKGSACVFELDTNETRSKKFYDRVDFDLLLTR